jgi:hypothetical protein
MVHASHPYYNMADPVWAVFFPERDGRSYCVALTVPRDCKPEQCKGAELAASG